MEANPQHVTALSVDRLNFISRVKISFLNPKIFFEEYQKTGTPVIITELLQDDCNWNLDYLCEKLGDSKVPIRQYGRERYKQDKRLWTNIGSGVDAQGIPFSKYAQMLRNKQAYENDIYIGKGSIKGTPLADSRVLKIIGEKLGLKPATDYRLYMGPGGHTSSMHYDTMDGTLVQLHGAKKVVLFPPTQMYNLYPFPTYTHLLHGLNLRCCYSQVSLENPDLQSFPKLQAAISHQHEAIVNQGEILYIPAGWWHEIATLDAEMVCSLTRFWRIYPTSRAIFSWSRWRSLFGMILASPYLLVSLAIALTSSNRKQKIRQLLAKL